MTSITLMGLLLPVVIPEVLSFSLGYFSLCFFTLMTIDKSSEAFKKRHKMGSAEDADLKILEKLERKSQLTCHTKDICDIDEKIYPPNAGAAWRYNENSISIFKNLLRDPFTLKERKAIYAHEFGHIKHFDSLFHSLAKCLYWVTAVFAFSTFSAHIALMAVAASSYCYYAISQIDELLADQFSAVHANPRALISGFEKIDEIAKQLRNNKPKMTSYEAMYPMQLYKQFKSKMGMSTHPPDSLRNAYLEGYAVEKEAAKCAVT